MKINCVGYSGEAKNGIIGYNCEGAASPLWFLELVTFKEIKIKLVKTFVGRVSNMVPENPRKNPNPKIRVRDGFHLIKFQVSQVRKPENFRSGFGYFLGFCTGNESIKWPTLHR